MDLLSPLRKDNTGYDLKQLFIGGEGTLSYHRRIDETIFLPKRWLHCGYSGYCDRRGTAWQAQTASGEQVEAFEIMPKTLLDVVLKHFPDIPRPLDPIPDFMILMEIASSDARDGAKINRTHTDFGNIGRISG